MVPVGVFRLFGEIEPIVLRRDDEPGPPQADSAFGAQPVDDASSFAAAALLSKEVGGDDEPDWRTAFLGANTDADASSRDGRRVLRGTHESRPIPSPKRSPSPSSSRWRSLRRSWTPRRCRSSTASKRTTRVLPTSYPCPRTTRRMFGCQTQSLSCARRTWRSPRPQLRRCARTCRGDGTGRRARSCRGTRLACAARLAASSEPPADTAPVEAPARVELPAMLPDACPGDRHRRRPRHGNAWDDLPSEHPEVAPDFAPVAEPGLTANVPALVSGDEASHRERARAVDDRVGFEEEASPLASQEGHHGRSDSAPTVIAVPATTGIPAESRCSAVANAAIDAPPAVAVHVVPAIEASPLDVVSAPAPSWRRRWRFR